MCTNLKNELVSETYTSVQKNKRATQKWSTFVFHHHVTVVILREGGQSFCFQLQHKPDIDAAGNHWCSEGY